MLREQNLLSIGQAIAFGITYIPQENPLKAIWPSSSCSASTMSLGQASSQGDSLVRLGRSRWVASLEAGYCIPPSRGRPLVKRTINMSDIPAPRATLGRREATEAINNFPIIVFIIIIVIGRCYGQRVAGKAQVIRRGERFW